MCTISRITIKGIARQAIPVAVAHLSGWINRNDWSRTEHAGRTGGVDARRKCRSSRLQLPIPAGTPQLGDCNVYVRMIRLFRTTPKNEN